MQPIFRIAGTYFGFIQNGHLFSRDGDYLGWVEDKYVWDGHTGTFRGQIHENKYIVVNRFAVKPVPKPIKQLPARPALPTPSANIPAVLIDHGWADAF